MTKDKLLLDTIKKQINKAKVVSFDIFDTLLVRPYIHPIDLFEHMEKAYERPGFAAERKDAERRTRIRHKELEDITFDMIYDEIDDEFKDMKQKEMDWEEMVLRANPELKQVYDYALAQGKKVVITSDMYLPTEFLAKVLRKNGFDNWDKLYVSGDISKKKGTGSLYSQLIKDMEEKANNILHIGDNKKSDAEVAQKLGFKTVLYEQVALQFLATHQAIRVFRKQTMGQLDSSILVAIFAYRWQQERCGAVEKRSYWQNLGFQYAGPIAYGYCRFIEKKAKEEGIDNLLFVARDGYTLQKVYNTFGNNISNSYIYTPRFLNMAYFFDFAKNNRYREFLPDILDFYVKNHEQLSSIINLEEANDQKDYDAIFEKNLPLLKQYADIHISNYKKYLDSLIQGKKNIAVVDLTTTYFSAHTFLEKFLNEDTSISSLYCAVYNLNHIPYQLRFDNWFYGIKGKEKAILFLEFLITSPEPPIDNVSKDGHPVYRKDLDKNEVQREEIYKIISDGIMEFSSEVKELFNSNDIFLQDSSMLKLLENFIKFPTMTDIEYMSKIKYSVDAGNKIYKSVLAYCPSVKEYIFSPIKTLQTIKRSTWKTPFQKFLLNGIYFKQKTPISKIIKILGFTFYRKTTSSNEVTTKRLFGILKTVKNINKKKKYFYFMGIKIFSKHRNKSTISLSSADVTKIIDTISLHTQRAISVAYLHSKTFAGFKNKYLDQTIVLIGAGPSVKQFSGIKKAIYVGLNRAFLFDKVHFNYLFTIDKKSIEQFFDKFWDYSAIKFIGDQNISKEFQIPESELIGKSDVLRYKTTARYLPGRFAVDLETEALANSTSVSIQAMQFILFTHPKRIYLVGIDCSIAKQEHFIGAGYDISKRGENPQLNDMIHINDWKRIKAFAEMYYPNTEIISVNPVGLKGVFRDVYTKEYLHKHPEINSDGLEILEDGEIK